MVITILKVQKYVFIKYGEMSNLNYSLCLTGIWLVCKGGQGFCDGCLLRCFGFPQSRHHSSLR